MAQMLEQAHSEHEVPSATVTTGKPSTRRAPGSQAGSIAEAPGARLDVLGGLLARCVAGRAAVRAQQILVARDAVPAPLDAGELTTRIARCIGIWETNRGKNDPAPRESALDTVAGVHASMATIEQATMPYAIGAIKKYKALRDVATPALTIRELNAAEARCVAVVALLAAVKAAAGAGTTPDDYITSATATIAATGLSDGDVRTMFAAVRLKATIDAAHVAVGDKAKKTTPQAQAAAIPEADRLGLGVASLTSYIRKPANWGENRAAWQRKAVLAMPGDVGARIEAVAVSYGGAALATPVIRSRVDAQLAKTPAPSEQEVVTHVGQANNPGEAGYGANVWATYRRLYPAAPAATPPS